MIFINKQLLVYQPVDESTQQKIKTFSILKYGNQGAFDLACVARKQMEKDYDYHPNHGR